MSRSKQQKSPKLNKQSVLVLGVLGILVAAGIGVSRMYTNNANTEDSQNISSEIPGFLQSSFKKTDWTKFASEISSALSGGPSKDGIPAIDTPVFEEIRDFTMPGSVQAIVLKDQDTVKVYPYNILVLHEIVNDELNGRSLSVTFCPLCGSAAVYDRELDGEVTTFGVSGALIESNMVMYDRASESLWQQSTGQALAGKYLGKSLKRLQFQLLTIAEAKIAYPNALVLSDDTGFGRDYTRNPYSGYEENEEFIFSPSDNDKRYPAKMIFVAFKIGDTSVAAPWLELKNDNTYKTVVAGQTVNLIKKNNELTILDSSGEAVPFYFEMWFSWAVQNQENSVVYDPNKI